MQYGGIILAGGRNSRMKRNKAWVDVGGKPIVVSILREMETMGIKVILVTNAPEEYAFLKVDMVSDLIPAQGPLSGIHAGLLSSTCQYNLVVACDMPFFKRELGATLLAQHDDFDAVVPLVRNRPEPLLAVYRRSVYTQIEALFAKGVRRCTALLPEISVHYVRESELQGIVDVDKAFFNVNTPADLERANLISFLGEDGRDEQTK